MKKNLLSILILALLIVNLVMTCISTFSVMSTNKKTAAVVENIATVLNIELAAPEGEEGEGEGEVSMADTALYSLADEMTILLAKGSDGTSHYALVKVALSMNNKSEGYETYGATIGDNEPLIKSIINEVIGGYTADEVQARSDEVKQKILDKLEERFESDFIYDVSFSEFIVQ
ncbi:MAG: flagellar basal body-associated FliL family protein [Lachnospiraceae bacterium]|nr:flagellar basal body-associated FliL family protein [Lachnospiraceae bacterium]